MAKSNLPPNSNDNINELKKVYASGSSKLSSQIYDDWSADYEEHMRGVGYTHPAVVAAMLSRYQPPGAAAILDAGSGTGIMGEILPTLGYPNLHGFDASKGMLAHAKNKNIYQDLKHGLLGERLEYDDNQFAAAIASGVFTEGHAPLDGLDELIRIVEPGGHIAFSISRIYLGEMFETKAQSLEKADKWRRIEASQRYDSAPFADDILWSQVFVFQVI